MDITEAFRSEDISKTDFFDFVVGQDGVGDSQQLNRTLKSMGIFIEPPTSNNASAYAQDVKETNNNHLMTNTVSEHHHHQHNHIPSTYEQTPTSFWSTAATTTSSSNPCDKEAVRIESAILEDLSKLWNESPSGEAGGIKGSGNGNNTDGAIYTLTVLNGGHSPGSWYRTPENPAAIKQEEENNHGSPHDHQHKQQMSPHGQVPSSSASSALDLDSILSIIPTQHHPPSSPSTNHHYRHNGFGTSSNAMSPHQEKSEQYTAVFEDSNYNNKDCISNGISHSPNNGTESPIGSGFNNNDWKMANNNSNNNTTVTTAAAATADSLLRNALQGKSCFLGRYNGNVPAAQQKMNCSKDNTARTLSSSSPPKAGDVYITGDMVVATDEHRSSPLMAESVVMFDGGGSTTGSSHTMDDILLYQGEDLEQQINIIANDVLESASRRQQQSYCNLDQNSNSSPTSSMYIPSPMLATDTLVHHHSPIMSTPSPHLHHHHHHHHHHLSPILQQPPQPPPPQSSISTTSRPAKKYSKKPTGGVKSHMQGSQHQGSNGNGVRKERSLHYCNICNKGFKDKYSVNVHIRTHTGEKPFACTVCGKSFRQKAHLAKHYQTHITQKNNSGQTGNASGYKNSKARFNGAKAPTS